MVVCIFFSTAESLKETISNVTESVEPYHTTQVMTLTDHMAGEDLQVEDPANEVKLMPNPFDDTHVGDLLTRRYLVASFEWTSSDTFGTQFAKLDFPDALLAKPFIVQKLQRFRYFRAGVRVTVELNGNTGAAGALLFWHYPYAGGRVFSTAEKRLLNPVVISAQKASSVTVEIPYLYPHSWLDMTSASDRMDKIGTIGFQVLSQLRKLSESVSDVHARVFAEFVNPEVSWPVPRDILPTVEAHGKRLRGAQGPPANDRTGYRSEAPSRAVAAEEAKEKSSKGVISGVARAVGTVAPTLSVIPEVGLPLSLGAQVIGSLAPLLESMGLGKPNNTSAVQYMVPQVFNGWAHMCGLSNTARLAADPDQSLLGPTVPDPCYDLRELAQRPSYVGGGVLSPEQAPGQLVYTFNLKDGPPGDTHIAWDTWVRNGFSMYKGGIKFKVQFWSTQMVTCRVAIVLMENGVNFNLDSSLPDAPIKIVDIEGDCEIDFTVPYVDVVPYRDRNASPPFALHMHVINPVSSLTGDMEIGFSVWRAFADDFQAQFPELWYTAQLPVPEAHGYVNEQFKEPFEPLAYGAIGFADAGWVADEQVYDLRAIMKRPILTQIISGTEPYDYDPWYRLGQAQVNGKNHPFLYWLLAFNYVRGSIRNHWTTRPPSYQAVGKAAVPLSNSSQPFEEFELPWYSQIPYTYTVSPTWGRGDKRNKVIHVPLLGPESSTNSQFLFTSFGEDLELGYPLAPPMRVSGYDSFPTLALPADYSIRSEPGLLEVRSSGFSRAIETPSTTTPTVVPDTVDEGPASIPRDKDHRLSGKRSRQE